jgi:hypothetical protein
MAIVLLILACACIIGGMWDQNYVHSAVAYGVGIVLVLIACAMRYFVGWV